MTTTDYIADDPRSYAPNLGGVSRDGEAAPVKGATVDDGLRRARKGFALFFAALTVLIGGGAIFYDGSLVLYAGLAAFMAVVSLFADKASPPTYANAKPIRDDLTSHDMALYGWYETSSSNRD